MNFGQGLNRQGDEKDLYKIFITFDQIFTKHKRTQYNLIDILGDVGGVLELLIFIFGVVMYPWSEFSFLTKALQRLYLARTKKESLFIKKKNKNKKVKVLKVDTPEYVKENQD